MLYRRGKVWWCDIYIPIPNSRRKRRHRQSLDTTTRFQALHRLRELTAQLEAEAGKLNVNVRTFSQNYFEWARTHKPASVASEEMRLRRIVNWLDEQRVYTICEITPHHIERLRVYLLEENLAPDGYAPRYRTRTTVNRYLQALRGMIYKAIDWGAYDGENPLRKVKFFREGGQVKPLSEAEITRVLEVAKEMSEDPHARSTLQRSIYDILLLVLNTGLRRTEVMTLKWSDIKNDELYIKGKGDKGRVVPLNAEARAIIKRQPRRMSPYIFDVPNRASCSVLRRTTETIGRRAGVPFRLHLLRHAFATRLLASGVDVVTISALLGHSKIMTSLLYSHTDKARKRKAVNGITVTK